MHRVTTSTAPATAPFRFFETAPAGSDFLAGLYADVETQARVARLQGLRVVLARIGVVIGAGAANPKWIAHVVDDPSGALSWIYREDVADMLCLIVESDRDGAFNLTTRRPTTAREIAELMRSTKGRKANLALARLAKIRAHASAESRLRSGPEHEAEAKAPERHVVFRTHWAYPAKMELLGYRWQVADISQALSSFDHGQELLRARLGSS